MKRHSEIGYRILKSNTKFSKIAHAVLHHHEWVDGTGYPNGLVSNEIPRESKILSVCEAFDDLTNERAYHAAMSVDDAIAELESCVDTQFDKEVVADFVNMIRGKKG